MLHCGVEPSEVLVCVTGAPDHDDGWFDETTR